VRERAGCAAVMADALAADWLATEGAAAAILPEEIALADAAAAAVEERPVSTSRLRRARSVRRSAALW